MKKSSVQKKPKTLLEVFYPVKSEYEEQVKIFEWAEIAKNEFPELEMLVGSLNGVRLSIGLAVKSKKAGLKRGYPDIGLDVKRSSRLEPLRQFGGLRIELKKANGGKLSPDQMWWLQNLTAQGFRAICCWGAARAIREITSYLEGRF